MLVCRHFEDLRALEVRHCVETTVAVKLDPEAVQLVLLHVVAANAIPTNVGVRFYCSFSMHSVLSLVSAASAAQW